MKAKLLFTINGVWACVVGLSFIFMAEKMAMQIFPGLSNYFALSTANEVIGTLILSIGILSLLVREVQESSAIGKQLLLGFAISGGLMLCVGGYHYYQGIQVPVLILGINTVLAGLFAHAYLRK